MFMVLSLLLNHVHIMHHLYRKRCLPGAKYVPSLGTDDSLQYLSQFSMINTESQFSE